MAIRDMGDTTHSNIARLTARRGDLDIVAGYSTGSPDIRWTAADWDLFAGIPHVRIDQGYTGSPDMTATVRDCETGAWQLAKAVNRTGWNVPRPTLYLGSPDTAQMAHDAGWRGDVWIARPSPTPPTAPPQVPDGINVVAVQWAFNGTYDWSAVFDPYWPAKPPAPKVDGWRHEFGPGETITLWEWCARRGTTVDALAAYTRPRLNPANRVIFDKHVELSEALHDAGHPRLRIHAGLVVWTRNP